MGHRVGFVQGRLSPPVNGRIQAFPYDSWREEFTLADEMDFRIMEWTLDSDHLHENPLMTAVGRQEIRQLSRLHGVTIPSLTADCFMQAPFWKARGEERVQREDDLLAVVESCSQARVALVVVPLVDNGRIEDREQENDLVDSFNRHLGTLVDLSVRVAIESDFPPKELQRLIERFDPAIVGINYDIGNSAALGYRVDEEMEAYGDRVFNVHVKDRPFGGTTVELGQGSADFDLVFQSLAGASYRGNYILQTARSASGNHGAVLSRYRQMVEVWMALSA